MLTVRKLFYIFNLYLESNRETFRPRNGGQEIPIYRSVLYTASFQFQWMPEGVPQVQLNIKARLSTAGIQWIVFALKKIVRVACPSICDSLRVTHIFRQTTHGIHFIIEAGYIRLLEIGFRLSKDFRVSSSKCLTRWTTWLIEALIMVLTHLD